MALSEHEQRLLEEMERGFYRTEADVYPAVTSVRRRVSYRFFVLGTLVSTLGVGVMVAGVSLQQLWLGLIGFALMLGGVVMMTKKSEVESESVTGAPSARKGGSGQQRESFSARMERRWNERMDGER